MKKKLIGLFILFASLNGFASDLASVLGYYQDRSGENYVNFSVFNSTPEGYIDFTGRLANPDSDYHTGFVFQITLDQYKKIFESSETINLKMEHSGDDDHQIRAWSEGNTRQVVISSKIYMEKKFLADKEFVITVENGKIVRIKHLVERKKHVLVLISLPGTYTYIDLSLPVEKVSDGLGVYGDNLGWPLGVIRSFENIERELAEYGTDNQFLE